MSIPTIQLIGDYKDMVTRARYTAGAWEYEPLFNVRSGCFDGGYYRIAALSPNHQWMCITAEATLFAEL